MGGKKAFALLKQLLETGHLIVLGYEVGSICGGCEAGVLTGQVLVGYPAGAGAQPSDVDRHLVLHDLVHQLPQRWEAYPLNTIENRIHSNVGQLFLLL